MKVVRKKCFFFQIVFKSDSLKQSRESSNLTVNIVAQGDNDNVLRCRPTPLIMLIHRFIWGTSLLLCRFTTMNNNRAATKLFGASHRIGWENDIQTMVIMNPSLKKNRASCQQDPMKLEVRSRELRDNRNNSNLSLWQCPLSFSLTHANYKILTWHDLLKFSDCTKVKVTLSHLFW